MKYIFIKISMLLLLIILNYNKAVCQDRSEFWITELDDSSEFHKVSHLVINGRYIDDVTNALRLSLKCNNLKYLELYNLKHSGFLSVICFNNSLQRLEVHEVNKLELPACTAAFNQIDTLIITGTNTTHLLNEIYNFSHVNYLALSSTKLRDLNADKLKKLTNLSTLFLVGNNITNVEFINSVNFLEYLSFANNKIKSFTLNDTFHHLKMLELGGNSIKNWVGLSLVPNLISLGISNNCLSSVPLEVGICEKLNDLNLSKNRIVGFDAFRNLKNLKRLNLSDNNLYCLPNKLAYLTNLSELNLSHNKELNMDCVVMQLLKNNENIEDLDISYCNISFVTYEISKLPKLKRLNLSGNKISKQLLDELRIKLPLCDIINKAVISGS